MKTKIFQFSLVLVVLTFFLSINGSAQCSNTCINFTTNVASIRNPFSGTNFAGFMHKNFSGHNYALLQQNDGTTYLNSASGKNIYFRIGNVSTKMILKSNGQFGIGTMNPTNLLTVNGTVEILDFTSAGGKNLIIGNDAYLTDIDNANMVGIYGIQNSDRAGIRLGSDGGYIFGDNGKIGIGTLNPTYKLTVKGDILASKVRVVEYSAIPDYVFEEDYDLQSIDEAYNYVNTHKHLPDVPSASEIEETNLDLAEMNIVLLKKVEEQFLYIVQLNERIKALEQKISAE